MRESEMFFGDFSFEGEIIGDVRTCLILYICNCYEAISKAHQPTMNSGMFATTCR
jgi:hypothetical protein